MQLGTALVEESFRKHGWARVRCFSQSYSVAYSLIVRNTDKFVKGFDLSESILSLASSTSCLPRPGNLGRGEFSCCLMLQIYVGQCKESREQEMNE